MARKAQDDTAANGETIVIKKYANRRLYNTASSSYITLEDLARMVRENVDFAVFDAKSGEDITHSILTQIIMDEEANGEQMLPVSFLSQLIEDQIADTRSPGHRRLIGRTRRSARADGGNAKEAGRSGQITPPHADKIEPQFKQED